MGAFFYFILFGLVVAVIGGVHVGGAIIWGLLVGCILLLLRRQDIFVETGEDVLDQAAHEGREVHRVDQVLELLGALLEGAGLEVGASEVDATLETRWRRVIDAIGISPEWLSETPWNRPAHE